MNEKLELLELIQACSTGKLTQLEFIQAFTETTEQQKQRRDRTLKDLKNKGNPFENYIAEQLELLANVSLYRKNLVLNAIPFDEYKTNPEKYQEMLNTPDIIVLWKAKPQIGIECGFRKSYYYNNDLEPPCCTEWNEKHISIPNSDLKAFIERKRKEKLPKYFVFIGKPTNIYAIVKLETWQKQHFINENPSFHDHPEQSVICLKQTPHHTDIEQWMKAVHIPKK